MVQSFRPNKWWKTSSEAEITLSGSDSAKQNNHIISFSHRSVSSSDVAALSWFFFSLQDVHICFAIWNIKIWQTNLICRRFHLNLNSDSDSRNVSELFHKKGKSSALFQERTEKRNKLFFYMWFSNIELRDGIDVTDHIWVKGVKGYLILELNRRQFSSSVLESPGRFW